MKTRRGLPVSTDETEAVAAFDIFANRLARIDQGVEEILSALEQAPDVLCLRIAAAAMFCFGQDEACQQAALEHLQAAVPMEKGATSWEKAWLSGLRLWQAKDYEAAACRYEAITEQWPQDLPAAKAAEFLYYILGQHYSGPRFRAHMERLAPVLKEDPDYLAARAFSHELCGDMQSARHYAEQALEQVARVPWAHHCLAHVLLWEGNPDEAARLTREWLPLWRQSGRVIYCHNAWHTALMHLDRLEINEAWQIYETDIWGHQPNQVGEHIDAISLLWRMELAGIEVPASRWQAIAPHVIPHVATVFMPFISLHHAYALARAGETDALQHQREVIRERASQTDHEARRVWDAVGRDAVEAAVALAQRDDQAAADGWRHVLPRITQVGGSDAQDDLFRFSYFESQRRSGHLAEAREYLTNRLQQKRPSPLENQLRASLAD